MLHQTHLHQLRISPLSGEFADSRAESAYLLHHLDRTRAELGATLLFCTLFFLGFFVTDLAALGLVPDAIVLLCARLLVALVAGTGAFLARRRPLSSGAVWRTATIAETVALGCFMVIAVHRPAEFHWHAMSLAIMLLVIYLYIPNRFCHSLTIAAIASLGFFVFTLSFANMAFADLLTMGMLLTLVNTFGSLAARRYQVTAREEYRSRRILQDAAERDHLSGCYNRRYLHERLMGAPVSPMAVILCDIDRFKQINDAHGHAAGDAVLRQFSDLLLAAARPGRESVVRYGGEEFLLVLPDTGLDAAVRLAESLRIRLSLRPIDAGIGATSVFATASFGVASGTDATLSSLIKAADELMYSAKRRGRNRVEALALGAHDAHATADRVA